MDVMMGRVEATPGNRDALARALVDEVDDMPGCTGYVVSVDPADATGVWIAESWVDHDAHRRWLDSEPTRALAERLRPLMVGFSERHELERVRPRPS